MQQIIWIHCHKNMHQQNYYSTFYLILSPPTPQKNVFLFNTTFLGHLYDCDE